MHANLRLRIVLGFGVGLALIMIAILGFHLGGPAFLLLGLYLGTADALIGGIIVLVSVALPIRSEEDAEPCSVMSDLPGSSLDWAVSCGALATASGTIIRLSAKVLSHHWLILGTLVCLL